MWWMPINILLIKHSSREDRGSLIDCFADCINVNKNALTGKNGRIFTDFSESNNKS